MAQMHVIHLVMVVLAEDLITVQLVQMVTLIVLEFVVKMINITIQVQELVQHVIHLVMVVLVEELIIV